MKKVLKQPCFYVLVAYILILAPTTIFLYHGNFLPDDVHFYFERWYVSNWQNGGVFAWVSCTCALVLIFGCIRTWFVKGKTVKRKIIVFFFYFFLLFLTLSFMGAGCAWLKARNLLCISHLKTMGMLLNCYAEEYQNCYPPDLHVFGKWYGSESIKTGLCCPGRWHKIPFEGSDYHYYGKGKKATEPVFLLMEDKARNHYSVNHNCLYSDGYVSNAKEQR